jgi:hypothetical protein
MMAVLGHDDGISLGLDQGFDQGTYAKSDVEIFVNISVGSEDEIELGLYAIMDFGVIRSMMVGRRVRRWVGSVATDGVVLQAQCRRSLQIELLPLTVVNSPVRSLARCCDPSYLSIY